MCVCGGGGKGYILRIDVAMQCSELLAIAMREMDGSDEVTINNRTYRHAWVVVCIYPTTLS